MSLVLTAQASIQVLHLSWEHARLSHQERPHNRTGWVQAETTLSRQVIEALLVLELTPISSLFQNPWPENAPEAQSGSALFCSDGTLVVLDGGLYHTFSEDLGFQEGVAHQRKRNRYQYDPLKISWNERRRKRAGVCIGVIALNAALFAPIILIIPEPCP